MDEGFELFENRETDRLAKLLSEEIKKSREYAYYRKCLAELMEEPELYAEVNEVRRINFELQNSNNNNMSYEQYAQLSARMTNLRKNPLVSHFLNSELGIGRLVSNIYRQVIEGIELDMDFLDD